jgi:hypothetical protein
MQGERHPALVALREAREAAIEHLSFAFAQDQLSLEEFERRVGLAFEAREPAELLSLRSDLRAQPASEAVEVVRLAPSTALITASPTELAPGAVKSDRLALAILGNVERRGSFSMQRSSRALAVLGNVEIDLREVVLPPGVTELRVRAVLGNVEIVVPPQLAVEMHGAGILGSFSGLSRVPRELGDEPVLRVIGTALLGNVEIRTLPRGADAHGARPPLLPEKTR